MPGSAARRTSLLGEVRLQQRAAERARLTDCLTLEDKNTQARVFTRACSVNFGTLISPNASTHTATDGSASATSAAALPPQCTASSKRERPLRSVCAKCTRPSGRLRAACIRLGVGVGVGVGVRVEVGVGVGTGTGIGG